MKKRVSFFVLLMALIVSIAPFSGAVVQAQTFEFHLPSFGLYCDDSSVIQGGNVSFNLSDFQPSKSEVISHSCYQIKSEVGRVEHFSIPFIARAYAIPDIVVSANGKPVKGQVRYGNSYFGYDDLDLNEGLNDIASVEIDEARIGTLYTLTPTADKIKLNIKRESGQRMIRAFQSFSSTHLASGESTYNLENVQASNEYSFFIIDGEATVSAEGASVKTESISGKEYVDRIYNELKEYFDEMGGVPVEFLYAQFNTVQYEASAGDLFFDSISNYRLMVYEFSVEAEATNYEIEYDQSGLQVLGNGRFSPVVYMIEQRAAAGYSVKYSLSLNEEFPFFLESSSAASNVDGVYTITEDGTDFYAVFSSSERPKDMLAQKTTKLKAWQIVLLCVGGVAVVVFCVSMGFLIRDLIKSRKSKR